MTIASMQSSSGSLEIWLAMEESSAANQTEQEPAETPALTPTSTGTTWRHRLFTILFYAVFLFIIIVAGRLFWSNASVLRKAVEVPLWYWALPSALYLGTLVFKGLSFDLLAEVFGARVPLRDSIALTSIGLLGNYALPGNASLPLRSLYFQRVHQLSYKQFIPIALAGFIYGTAQYGVVAGLVALYLGPVPSKTYSGVMIVFSGVSLAAMILLLLPYRRLVTPYRQLAFLDRYIAMALEGWRLLLGSHARFGRWLLCEFLRAFFEVTFFLSVVWPLGVPMGLGQAIIIVFAKECVLFLRLTPGSFGIAEGVQVFFAAAFGLDIALVVVAALISRVIEIAWLSVLSLVLAHGLHTRIAAAKSTMEAVSKGVESRGSKR